MKNYYGLREELVNECVSWVDNLPEEEIKNEIKWGMLIDNFIILLAGEYHLTQEERKHISYTLDDLLTEKNKI